MKFAHAETPAPKAPCSSSAAPATSAPAWFASLLESGRKVRVVDSLVYGDEPLRGVFGHPNLEMRIGDCRNIQDMVAAVRGVDSIIDLAAIVGDPACEQDKQTALEINYAATRMLIEVAKGHGIQRFIFASSCSVYGATDVMMDEHSAVKPISLYGQTKLDSEHALLAARRPRSTRRSCAWRRCSASRSVRASTWWSTC